MRQMAAFKSTLAVTAACKAARIQDAGLSPLGGPRDAAASSHARIFPAGQLAGINRGFDGAPSEIPQSHQPTRIFRGDLTEHK